jgi:hypothetical protein
LRIERTMIILLAALYVLVVTAELADMIGAVTLHPASANAFSLLSSSVVIWTGNVLTFSATGTTDFGGCASPSPDGGGACGALFGLSNSSGPFFGIASFRGPINALVGVFVNANVPGGTAPAGFDFNTAGATSQATLSPQLNQVFFIGDGVTGTATGATQQFVIPAGATRLFLASSDGAGASFNNSGSFNVSVSDSAATPLVTPPSAPAGAPLPGTGLMALFGFAAAALFLGASARFRRRA